MTQSVIKPGEILWTPTSSSSSSSSSLLRFAPLDDVVMGGASYSTIDNNTGIWCGYVTDANNGGFVGIYVLLQYHHHLI
jgi:outer membrane protein assembly factor BamB